MSKVPKADSLVKVEEPKYPLRTNLQSSRVSIAAIVLDNKSLGIESLPETRGSVEETADWLMCSAEDLQTSGDTEISQTDPLANAIREAMVNAGVIEPTMQVARVVLNTRAMAKRLARVVDSSSDAVAKEDLEALRDFCIALSRAMSVREPNLTKAY